MSDATPTKPKRRKKAAPKGPAVALVGPAAVSLSMGPGELGRRLAASGIRGTINAWPGVLAGRRVALALRVAPSGRVLPIEAVGPLSDADQLRPFGRLVAVEYERDGRTYRHDYSKGRRIELHQGGGFVFVPALQTKREELT
ncbi:MAG: hypothetical protein AB7I35_21690 [Ramlibacter sp.]